MSRLRALLAAVALLVLALLVLALPAIASAVTVNEVAKEVRCPTCNTTLDVSSSPVASDMRIYIKDRIDEGWTKEEIIDGLVVEFGPEVRTTPPKSGFDLVAWIVPALAVAFGLAMIPVLTRLWARRGRGGRRGPPPTEEEEARLQERLERIDPA